MADEILAIDQNGHAVMGGLTNDANLEIRNFRMDPSTGRLLVDVGSVSIDTTGLATEAKQDDIITAIEGISAGSGGTEYEEDTAHTAAEKLTMAGVVRKDTAASLVGADSDRTELIVDGSGRLHVNVGASALPTGAATSAKQDSQIDILGTIDTSLDDIQTILDGDLTTIIGHVDGIEGLLGGTLTVAGNIASGSADSGNPVKVGGRYNSTDPTLANGQRGDLQVTERGSLKITPFSLNSGGTIGFLADNADDVADSSTQDRQPIVARMTYNTGGGTWDRVKGNKTDGMLVNLGSNNDVGINAGTAAIGKLLPPDVDVTAHSNYARKYYTSAGAATDGIIWSPAAGKRWHVLWIYINVSAAATVTLEDDKSGGDDPVFKGEFAANGGVFLTFPEKYPMASGEDAADLLITTSAGNVYVTCGGYEV